MKALPTPITLAATISVILAGSGRTALSQDDMQDWHWQPPDPPTLTAEAQSALEIARAELERRLGEDAALATVFDQVTVRESPQSDGHWVNFRAPVCYVPPGVERSTVMCGLGIDVLPNGTINLSSSQGVRPQPVPLQVAQLVDEALRTSEDWSDGLDELLVGGEVTVVDHNDHLWIEIVPLSRRGDGATMRLVRETRTLVDIVIGHIDEEPEGTPEPAPPEALASTEDAAQAAFLSGWPEVANSLEGVQAARAEGWSDYLSGDPSIRVERSECVAIARRIEQTLDPGEYELILWGDLEDLRAEIACYSVIATLGFQSIIGVVDNSGRLLFVWTPPEG